MLNAKIERKNTDNYGKKQIVKDGVIPADFIFSSSGYLAVYDMENAAKSEVPLLELQQVLVNIHAFWGIIVSRHKTCH